MGTYKRPEPSSKGSWLEGGGVFFNFGTASLLDREDDFWWEPSKSPGVLSWLPHHFAFSPSLQDPFVAFHINKGLVRKYMNSFLFGELSLEQPSFEPMNKELTDAFREFRPRWNRWG